MLAASATTSRRVVASLRAHKLRTVLTVVGLTMGVATLITVMTIVQGANLYVEQKIANLGTNVFQVARTPFAVTDFNARDQGAEEQAHRNGRPQAVQASAVACKAVGATRSTAPCEVHYRDHELADVNIYRPHAEHGAISTRARCCRAAISLSGGSARRAVCLIGDSLVAEVFRRNQIRWASHPDRQRGVHGDRDFREDRLACSGRTRTTSSSIPMNQFFRCGRGSA